MATITTGSGTITPDLVLGYQAASDTRNARHSPLTGPASFTLRGEGLRAGTLQLLFEIDTAAYAAYAQLAVPGVFTLASTEEPEIGMKFARDGQMTIALDSQLLKKWVVSVGFQEIE